MGPILIIRVEFLFYFRPFVVFLCRVFDKLLRFYQMTSYPPWSVPWQGDKEVIWDCIWDPPNLYHFFCLPLQSTDQHKKSLKFGARNLMVLDYSLVHVAYISHSIITVVEFRAKQAKEIKCFNQCAFLLSNVAKTEIQRTWYRYVNLCSWIFLLGWLFCI